MAVESGQVKYIFWRRGGLIYKKDKTKQNLN